MAELEGAAGADPRYDAHLKGVKSFLATLDPGAAKKDLTPSEWGARALVEDLAVALQAAVLLRSAPPAVADAFCAGRLGPDRHPAFGTLPCGVDAEAIVARALAV